MKIYPATFILTVLILFTGIAFADSKREEKPRFKGVELYSWKTNENQWVFTLLNGTNRIKSARVIKESKNQLKDTASLKQALRNLAKNEQIYWIHKPEGFGLPPEALKKEILTAAKQAEVKLFISGQKTAN